MLGGLLFLSTGIKEKVEVGIDSSLPYKIEDGTNETGSNYNVRFQSFSAPSMFSDTSVRRSSRAKHTGVKQEKKTIFVGLTSDKDTLMTNIKL